MCQRGHPQDGQDGIDTTDSGAGRLQVSARSHLVAVGITAKMEKARPAEAWEGRQLGPAGHRSHQLADGRVGAGRPVRSFWWQRSGSTRGQQVLCPLPLPCLCPLSQ